MIIKLPIEPGWEVSKDREPLYNKIKLNLQDEEDLILTTKMKRSRWGQGFTVLTNKNLWWVKYTSKFESFINVTYDLTHVGGISSGQRRDKLHRLDRFVPGTNRKMFSLYNIVGFENKGKGKYVIYWLKFDRKGNPKIDKKGNYKTKKVVYRVLKSKNEEEFKYVERREQFGHFLRKAIDNLPNREDYTSVV